MVIFECTSCRRNLRGLNKDQGRRATCPCGMPAWIPGESMGFWLTILDQFWESKTWNCPGCQQKIPVEAAACPECKRELPTLVKPS